MARAGMDLAERLGARFMLPGNVYNYGQGMPALLRPDTPPAPTSRKGRLRVELEDEIQRRCIQGRLRATIIRAGDYFGGGTGSWLDLVIAKSLRDGKLVYPGPTDVPHAWAYLPDFARTFVAAAARPETEAAALERFHFAGHTLTGAQLLAGLERAALSLGLRPGKSWKHGGVSWSLLRLGGAFVPMLREISEMSYLWRVPHELDGAALERALGPGISGNSAGGDFAGRGARVAHQERAFERRFSVAIAVRSSATSVRASSNFFPRNSTAPHSPTMSAVVTVAPCRKGAAPCARHPARTQ
jgi:hypothetical protein